MQQTNLFPLLVIFSIAAAAVEWVTIYRKRFF